MLSSLRNLLSARRLHVLSGIAVIALLGAGGLFVAAARADDRADSVILTIDETSVPVPSTVPPIAEPQPAAESDASGAASGSDAGIGTDVDTGDDEGPAVSTPTAAALSPLADLLGEQYSAIPDEVEPRPRPVGLEIDAFDVSRFPVRAIGLEDDGQLEIPDETEIGWYQYGATSGRPGATVLAAHVSWNRTVGPFGSLGTLEPGNQVAVTLDDGTTRQYEVFERAIYGKLELPRERIWRNTGPETLVLITCGGDFNPDIRRYNQNIVVYAAPVG